MLWLHLIASDKWCQQSGIFGSNVSGWAATSFVFHKEFIDLSYTIFVQGNWSDAASSSCKITAKRTNGVDVTYANNLYSVQPSQWIAFGFIL